MKNKPAKKELMILMSAGCLLGILCFGMVYGFKIVNFTYDGWLFHGDMDLKQHYLGFCHFRNTPWHFPIGLIDTLSMPYSMSIVYTDSIPIFALIFKVFNGILPVHFQYFGFFGLLCYMMMGMLSPVLIRRFSDKKTVCIGGSLFFILSFPILHRMFYHTALSAQWIIILALIVWFYNDISDLNNTKKLCIIWSLIGILSVSIHSYFVFMTGIVLAASVFEGIIRFTKKNKEESENRKWTENAKNILQIASPVFCMGASSFILLYLLGGFYGKGSVSGDGFGSFNGNLSSYINPLDFGTVFKGFELNGMFEFEGFAYLGAGILLIVIAVVIGAIVSKIKGASILKEITLRKKVILITVIIVLLISCFPAYSFGSVKILSIPVPGFVAKLLGICRTNARFVWVGMYLIMISALYYIAKNYDKPFVKILFAAAVILQLYDVSGIVKQYHERYSVDREYNSDWDSLNDTGILDNKSQFAFMYNESLLMMDSAYYGYLHNMGQNSYYYARTIYDEIDENVAYWKENFLNGEIREDVVYVFRPEDYTNEFDEVVKRQNATKTEFKEFVVITK